MQCGSEYLATVEQCPDCELPLVDQPPDGPPLDASADGEVAYDLAEWAVESRVMIEQLVEGEGVPHAWEGTTLVIPGAFEARVDALIEQVEVTTLPTLDPDAPKVAYNLDDWTDEQHGALQAAFAQAGIAFEYDADGDLVVLEDDQDRVEALIDAIDTAGPAAIEPAFGADDEWADDEWADDEGASADESIDAAEVLSDLFVAADKLMHNATDHDGVLGLVAAAASAEEMRVPYGFSPAVWRDIVGQAVHLKGLLEGDPDAVAAAIAEGEAESDGDADDDVDDAVIESRARTLRDTLRPYV
jgi:hypothetical protein